MRVILASRRHEQRERNGRSKSGKQSPAQNAARPQPSEQRRGAQRAEYRANRIHRALESKCAPLLLWRDGVGEQCVARRPPAAAPCPSQRAHYQNRGPTLRKRVSECGKPRRGVSDDSRGLAQLRAIRNPAARQFCKTRKAVRNTFDHSQRKCRRAEARKKCRKNRSCGFMSPIREQTGEADAQYAAREPALR